MSLVGCNFDSWGIAVLNNLVTALVGQSDSQKSRDSDESLKQNRHIISRMISILSKDF